MPIDHTNILIELNKTVKTLNFYPGGHPALKTHLASFLSLLKQAASQDGEIKWTVDQKGFYSGGKPIATAFEGSAALAKQFFLRKIKTIVFRPDISIDDIPGFVSLLNMEPEEILAGGGAERLLAKKGVTGVLLNEMSYDELKSLTEELEEEDKEKEMMTEEAVEEEAVEEEAEEVDEGTAEEELPLEIEPPKPDQGTQAEKEETLGELLEGLKKETDALRYTDRAVRITEKATSIISEGGFDEVFPVILVFKEHTLTASGLPGEIRETALGHLRGLLGDETINYLIGRLADRDEPEHPKIAGVLSDAGDQAVRLLLDALVGEREAHARRRIYNTLVKFGETIRAEVEKRLADERWYAVRQMVSLLGALGGIESLDALEAAYAHRDIRVKKEVFKSLARIPSERSSKILMGALKNGERTLRGQAIISLGMLKDPDAVDTIGRIALKRDPFKENLEQRKEAVKALGICGDQKAVPYLTELLFKKGWFGKRDNEEIRSLAIVSLGKIGSDEALEAIERVSGESTGMLYNTCRRVLEGRR